jgi:hypothetical protein
MSGKEDFKLTDAQGVFNQQIQRSKTQFLESQKHTTSAIVETVDFDLGA